MTDTTIKFAKLNEQSQIVFKKWSSDTVNTDLNKKKRLSDLIALGWKSTMFVSPKSAGSTATDASWTFAKDAINSGFPKAAQDLMAVSPKVAGDKTVKGQTRAYWNRQANAILGDLRKQMAIAEEIAADIKSGKQGAEATTRTAEVLTYEALMDCVTRIQKAESFNVDDVADFCQAINDLANQIDRS